MSPIKTHPSLGRTLMGVPRHFSKGGGKIFFYLNTWVDLFLDAYFSLGVLPTVVEKTLFQFTGGGQECPVLLPLGDAHVHSYVKQNIIY